MSKQDFLLLLLSLHGGIGESGGAGKSDIKVEARERELISNIYRS